MREVFKMKCLSWPPQPEFYPDNLCYFVKEGYFHETLGVITWSCILLPRTRSSIRSVGKVQAGMQGTVPHRGRTRRAQSLGLSWGLVLRGTPSPRKSCLQ